jgi:protein-S-isoprenylcysteine O-methyltransferase Ste14
VRHPQYVGFILVMFGFLFQWPTLLTLAMFPVLVFMYVRADTNLLTSPRKGASVSLSLVRLRCAEKINFLFARATHWPPAEGKRTTASAIVLASRFGPEDGETLPI